MEIINSNLGSHAKFEGSSGSNSGSIVKSDNGHKNGTDYVYNSPNKANDEDTNESSDDNTMTSTANANEENGRAHSPASYLALEALTDVSPVALLKAIKNETEIRGFINCHIRDSAALCSYFVLILRS